MIGIPPPPKASFGRIVGDCFVVTMLLLVAGSLCAGAALHGIAGGIQALGDAVRWVLQ